MKNYYIMRDENKKISGLFARPQHEGQEKLKETSKEIVAFLKKRSEPTEAQLNEQKIKDKMRQMAIESLQADNELPPDFEG
jgi:hypothetical protein